MPSMRRQQRQHGVSAVLEPTSNDSCLQRAQLCQTSHTVHTSQMRRTVHAMSCLAMILGTVVPASAQLPQTRLYATFPPGAQAGTTVDLTLTNGADLEEIDKLQFNHAGIKAVQKMRDVGGVQQPIANTFTVTVDASVPAGQYEVRAGGLYGVSNPRSFSVGTMKELQEAENNNTPEQATALELNNIVNGRSNGGADVDYYKFTAKAGQRLIILCPAAQIDSRMTPVLELYDAKLRRLDYSRRGDRNDDPLLDFPVPADGEYYLRVYDHVYAGNNDYFYRLIVQTGPYIDYILPPAGVPGTTGKFTLFGRNLPNGQPSGVQVDGKELEQLTVDIAVPNETAKLAAIPNVTSFESGMDGFSYVLKSPAGDSNPVVLFYAESPVALEQEPNDGDAESQPISAPGELAGSFQTKGDIDNFTFEAKAKAAYWINVEAQQIGSSADPYLTVQEVKKDDKGKETIREIKSVDDDGTNLADNVFDTLTDDPTFKFVAPNDGVYRVVVRDRYFESRGNARLRYLLSIRPDAPDFRLVALPLAPLQNDTLAQAWAPGLRKGDNFRLEVLTFRRDGFNGDIDISVEGLPAGVTCAGASIAAGTNSGALIFSAAEDAAEWIGNIKIIGKSRVDDAAKAKALTAAKVALSAAETAGMTAAQAHQAAVTAAQQATATKQAAEAKAKTATDAVAKATAAKAALDKNLVAAQSASKQAGAEQTAANKALADATANAKTATENATAAKAAAEKEADNKELADAAAAAQTAADAATKAAQVAEEAKTAAEKKAAEAANLVVELTKQQTAATKTLTDAQAAAAVTTKASTAAAAALAKADAALKAAEAAKTASDQKVAEATNMVKQAEAAYQASVHELAHAARPATIVWDGVANVRPASRLSRSIALSVLKEQAPYQVTTEVTQVEANQGRQILVPVKLAKRNGFDANVALTFFGQPKNVQIENKTINKGKDEELLRVFVANNAPTGKYTLYLRSQGQVSYSRNPEKAERLKAEAAAAAKKVTDMAEAAKVAAEARNAATKQAAADANEVKKAAAVKDAAVKKHTPLAATAKTALAAKQAADKAAPDTAAAAKTATEQLKAAQKVAAEATANAKQAVELQQTAAKTLADAEAAAKQAADDKAEQAKLDAAQAAVKQAAEQKQQADTKVTATTKAAEAANKQVEVAEATAKTAVDAASKAEAAKTTADKAYAAAAAAASKAAEDVANAEKAVVAAQTAATTSEAARVKAEADAKTAEAASKAAAAAKTVADKAATDAANAAKAKNVNVYAPSTPIIIDIKQSPATLSATVPNGGAIKRGEKIEVKVGVKRINDFTGPMTLTLPLPPGVTGLSAEPVTIPADKNDGVLTVVAAADATEGQLANMVVRASADFNGKAAVDQPVTLKVNK